MLFDVVTLLVALSLSPIVKANTIEFFYTTWVDVCYIDSFGYISNGITTHGGICALVPETERLYSCPAPDPTCWTTTQNCGKGSNTPDSNQILCGTGNETWCCTSDETCTTLEGQINICISAFSSPNKGISPQDATQNELNALNLANITATTQTANPTPFSTSTYGSSTSSSQTTSSSTTSSSQTSTLSASSTSSVPAATSSSSSSTTQPSHGLSGGATAGAVVGALGGTALIGTAILYLLRRKHRSANSDEKVKDIPAYDSMSDKPINNMYSSPYAAEVPAYAKHDPIPNTTVPPYRGPVEAYSGGTGGRPEMTGNSVERHEMA